MYPVSLDVCVSTIVGAKNDGMLEDCCGFSQKINVEKFILPEETLLGAI